MKEEQNIVIEKGQRIKFSLSLSVKNVKNIFDNEVIKEERVRNILLSLKSLIKTYENTTGLTPTTISTSSDLFYLVREALDIEEPEKSHYSDNCVYKGIKIKGGCNLENCEVVISLWQPSEIIVGS